MHLRSAPVQVHDITLQAARHGVQPPDRWMQMQSHLLHVHPRPLRSPFGLLQAHCFGAQLHHGRPHTQRPRYTLQDPPLRSRSALVQMRLCIRQWHSTKVQMQPITMHLQPCIGAWR